MAATPLACWALMNALPSRATVAGLRQNWDSVKAAVRAKGGNAEAQKFDALVAQAEAAKTPEDFAKVAKPILDEVDNLEKVFTK